MLDAARDADHTSRIEWVRADVRDCDVRQLTDSPAVDVIYSSATLQWVPDHLPLVREWASVLAPGGTLAITVPDNFDAPSHVLMRETAARHARSTELTEALARPGVPSPQQYLDTLANCGVDVRVWQTTYHHVLAPSPEEHPVLSWVRSTGLRPVLNVLDGPAERDEFLADYESELRAAYPVRRVGVVLPFTRTFAVAHNAT